MAWVRLWLPSESDWVWESGNWALSISNSHSVFLCLKLNQDWNSFKLTQPQQHWGCVTQLLLLCLLTGYTCVVFSTPSKCPSKGITSYRPYSMLFTSDQDIIYFYSKFSLKADQIWSKPKHNLKIFVWTQSDPSGTGAYCETRVRYAPSNEKG